MKILIVYGTSEGQTRKISRFMETVLQDEHHSVVIADATEDPPKPTNFDAILIGGSLHMGKYQRSVHHYIMNNIDELNERPTAFFSVCLAVLSELDEDVEELYKNTTIFLEQAGLQTREVGYIAGALKYTEYDFFRRIVMKMISKKQGRDTNTSENYEYTNWEAVKTFTLNYINGIET